MRLFCTTAKCAKKKKKTLEYINFERLRPSIVLQCKLIENLFYFEKYFTIRLYVEKQF